MNNYNKTGKEEKDIYHQRSLSQLKTSLIFIFALAIICFFLFLITKLSALKITTLVLISFGLGVFLLFAFVFTSILGLVNAIWSFVENEHPSHTKNQVLIAHFLFLAISSFLLITGFHTLFNTNMG